MWESSRSAIVLSVGLVGAGVAHVRKPKPFDEMIPPQLPGRPRLWTNGSAAVEVAVAGLVAVPATRKVGGLAAAALFVGVFPGNIQMAVNSFRRGRPGSEKIVSVARLPLQAPLIAWALAVRRGAR